MDILSRESGDRSGDRPSFHFEVSIRETPVIDFPKLVRASNRDAEQQKARRKLESRKEALDEEEGPGENGMDVAEGTMGAAGESKEASGDDGAEEEAGPPQRFGEEFLDRLSRKYNSTWGGGSGSSEEGSVDLEDYYDLEDDWVDDSELVEKERMEVNARHSETLHDGFFVHTGATKLAKKTKHSASPTVRLKKANRGRSKLIAQLGLEEVAWSARADGAFAAFAAVAGPFFKADGERGVTRKSFPKALEPSLEDLVLAAEETAEGSAKTLSFLNKVKPQLLAVPEAAVVKTVLRLLAKVRVERLHRTLEQLQSAFKAEVIAAKRSASPVVIDSMQSLEGGGSPGSARKPFAWSDALKRSLFTLVDTLSASVKASNAYLERIPPRLRRGDPLVEKTEQRKLLQRLTDCWDRGEMSVKMLREVLKERNRKAGARRAGAEPKAAGAAAKPKAPAKIASPAAKDGIPMGDVFDVVEFREEDFLAA